MARKRGTKSAKPLSHHSSETGTSHSPSSERKRNIVQEFADYFGNESVLANWQRLCADLGIEEQFTSKRQCQKALGNVWVNIWQFLDAKKYGKPIRKFECEAALASWTIKKRKIFPKEKAKQGGPARALLAHIYR